MLSATRDLLRATLATDASLTPADRERIMDSVKSATLQKGKTETTVARLLRRGEVARRLSLSLRAVDRLCSDGVLHKVGFPGRTRAGGIQEAEVNALIEGKVKKEVAA